MHAQNLPVYQGRHSQQIKHLKLTNIIDVLMMKDDYLATIPPSIAVSIFVLTLVVETVDLELMI